MVREIEDQQAALEIRCRRFQVRRLELFGSAAGETFDPKSSDLDFIVEFDDRPAIEYADAHFSLAEALTELFHRDVDLVVLSAVKTSLKRPDPSFAVLGPLGDDERLTGLVSPVVRPPGRANLAEVYPDKKPNAIPNNAGQLFRFVHEMKPGDLVIYPSQRDRQIHIGRVDGPYRYDPSKEESNPNLRSVKRRSSLPRTN